MPNAALPNAPTDNPPRLTLTQVLALEKRVELIGRRIADLCPRGDLGLGLDPEGPVGFAWVRALRRQGRLTELERPLVLSVFGEGREPAPTDGGAQAGERIWHVAEADRALRLEMQHGAIAALLGR